MIKNYEAFHGELSLSKEDVIRDVYRQNKDRISIKKEATAVKNLTRIIESTLRLANSKGFHAMTLRDLCADSGMSMGGLYAYISNKADLIHLIQSHGFIITRRTLLHYTSQVEDIRDRLFAAIKAHLYLTEQMRAWFYFSYMEAKSLPAPEKRDAVAIELEIEEIFLDLIEDGIKAKIYEAKNARLVSLMTKALLQDWYLKRRKYRDQGVGVDDYAVFVRDVIESYLLWKR
ncbi:TetR/AcrR family transcriptional regulator [Marinobacter sp. M3C]|jgi:AcrR family transcriptional regulator|uniref:TetR/AcrR family transcriptional regulator n=1 Tax=unclassified Marinobacter TaxID=83889 RepID=UPI00200DBCBA|nr:MULTISPECIES: TetR/AcrR family transcriptional regulator [unclassified Marinobacter]MCL1478474.1 TetR/AcrR family transcriptional regulator [Marinobacter sp.]MCL1485951.1 TetR/AcrR family transcriptional regulator [Marinobacter sp.]UQG55973.1 TetR/AcrR family transcriptional regulator [Marinobacter sp. M4C]UQG58600.1 TetR/AcrR family transcriptional regulator [Marinobacter sp. M3C]UQG64778.1 TetR/AcrR family transcriptional regulator [Marinobacter sp. M2C]